MRRLFTGLVLSLASACTFAAGLYDAIYQQSNSPNTYVGVHQNGSTIIAIVYDSMASNSTVTNNNIGAIRTTTAQYWEVMNGPLVGNVASLSGQQFFEGCLMHYSVTFTPTSAIAAVTGASNTTAGNVAGLRCTAAYPVGSIVVFNRVF